MPTSCRIIPVALGDNEQIRTAHRPRASEGTPTAWPCAPLLLGWRYPAESAFAFSESNSACEIAPLSSNCLAFSISPAGPLLAATSFT